MMDLRPVAFVIGMLLAVLAVAMGIPAILDFSIGHPDWRHRIDRIFFPFPQRHHGGKDSSVSWAIECGLIQNLKGS